MSIFSEVALLLLVYATIWYIVSLIIKRNDVADIAWGLGYVIVCCYLFITKPHQILSLILYGLVLTWGLRLSFHIYLRNSKKTEDFRYRQWREAWGGTFYWRSYFQVFLLQAFFLFVIISPVVWAVISKSQPFTWVTMLGLSVWVFGWIYQVVADEQLKRFVRQRKDKGEIMKKGLWKFSRHPNYFGEIVMWWGIYLMIIPIESSWWLIISPLTITILIAFVSGVPMLEKKYEHNKAFQDYKKDTPVLIPWL